jgi:hypothetical protein
MRKRNPKKLSEEKSYVTYGKTAMGQLLYDLLFTDLTPKYLARKHNKPITEIRQLREVGKKVYSDGKKKHRKVRKSR